MLIAHIYWIFIVWFATFILGFASLPFCRLVFRFSSDKGYAFSKIIGWFAVSYIAFFLVALKLVSLSVSTLVLSAVLWLAINAFLFIKFGKGSTKFFPPLRSIFAAEIIFLIAFSALLFLRGFNPEIYQIERFMDFGFIEALKNSVSLPLEDIWFAGENLNYYYFGHFIGFTILSLTGISTVPGFFLLVSLIFGLLAASIYRLAADFAAMLLGAGKRLRFSPVFSGALSLFCVLIAGTWYMAPWIFKKIAGTAPFFFYPEPTRIIPGTITEIPIYSFIVADIHAHVWGMLSGVLTLAVLYSLWKDENARLNFKNFYLWVLAFVLGLAYMINSWDAATLGALAIIVLFAKYFKKEKLRFFVFSFMLAAAAYATALPWGLFNELPVAGIDTVPNQSPFWPWFSFWGSSMAVMALYYFWKKYAGRRKKYGIGGSGFAEAVMLSALLFLAAMELVYVKDILSEGEWFRANTVFKLTVQVWLWINVFAGPVFVWFFVSLKKNFSKAIVGIMLAVYVSIGAVYPVMAFYQSSVENRNFIGIDRGLDWWEARYPDDFEAYLFLKELKDNLPGGEKMKHIVEAEGDSYTDVSRFSVFLGWSTIVGWAVHEWTWRGGYEPVAERRAEVREVYTGFDPFQTKRILDAYGVDYIIVGRVERNQYPGLIQEAKLRSMGKIIFEKSGTFVVEYKN